MFNQIPQANIVAIKAFFGRLEVRLIYFIMGLALGAVLATVQPLSERWPSMEERLNMIEPGSDGTTWKGEKG